jgi:[ribosomal protein S18]-alanine N-acetyltransferase
VKHTSIEVRRLTRERVVPLTAFFKSLTAHGADKFFHPHPLTAESARELAFYVGKDVYVLLMEDEEVLGYGMLRGWDEGYEIPSLGIAIHPDAQGQGLGRLLMNFLCVTAQRRGAKQIRLRVHRENATAVGLYRSLGYIFSPDADEANLIGILELRRSQ